MGTAEAILFFCGMLLLAMVLEPFARKINLPFSAVLIVIGFLISELVVFLGLDTGFRWYHFRDISFYVVLPILVFESALKIDIKQLFKMMGPVLVLAIIVFLISAGLIAIFLYYGINHPTGFPWLAAILTGVLLSATDPEELIKLCEKIHAPQRLILLIKGESLFNDGVAIVIFSLIMSMTMAGEVTWTFGGILKQFFIVFAGGILFGLVIGSIILLFSRWIKGGINLSFLTLIAAYGSFLIAEKYLQVSGVMAVLSTGLLIASIKNNDTDFGFITRLWAFNAHLAHSLLFLLVGISITITMFSERWLAMMIGVLVVLVSRAAGVFGILPVFNKAMRVNYIDFNYRSVLFWGGYRGAITIALSLSLPLELEYWFTIQSIAYGVVLFSLFFQAPTIKPLILQTTANES